MKKIIIKSSLISALLLPMISFAQQKDLKYLIDLTIKYFNQFIFLILGLALVMFVWNIYRYFISGSDDVKAKEEAGLYVMWSIIGFFVIISIYGLVNILTKTFDLDTRSPSGFFGSFNSSGSPFSGDKIDNSSNTKPIDSSASFSPL